MTQSSVYGLISNQKMKNRSTGDKFLALVLLNSLMRTMSKKLLDAIDKKVLQRLYLIAAKDKKTRTAILDYSEPKLKDKEAAGKFHTLLK